MASAYGRKPQPVATGKRQRVNQFVCPSLNTWPEV